MQKKKIVPADYLVRIVQYAVLGILFGLFSWFISTEYPIVGVVAMTLFAWLGGNSFAGMFCSDRNPLIIIFWIGFFLIGLKAGLMINAHHQQLGIPASLAYILLGLLIVLVSYLPASLKNLKATAS